MVGPAWPQLLYVVLFACCNNKLKVWGSYGEALKPRSNWVLGLVTRGPLVAPALVLAISHRKMHENLGRFFSDSLATLAPWDAFTPLPSPPRKGKRASVSG